MTKISDEVVAANESYAAAFGDKARLAMPPARRFACPFEHVRNASRAGPPLRAGRARYLPRATSATMTLPWANLSASSPTR